MRNRKLALFLTALTTACGDGVTDIAMRDGGYVQLAVGMWHSCGLTANGSVYCWGRNTEGQLGNGTTELTATPRRITATTTFTAIAAGSAHSCALAVDQTVYCWGANGSGQAGGGSALQATPAQLASTQRFAQITAGANHSCARTSNGAVFCWGANGQGQSGGSGTNVSAPRQVAFARPFVTISAGAVHTCGIDDRARALCWGGNYAGQLGDGTSRDASTPHEIAGPLFSRISAGYSHTCGIDAGSRALCWGSSDRGELGVGAVNVPGLPGALVPEPVHLGEDMGEIAAGYQASCAARRTGSGVCWGRGTEGQLGNGGTRDEWSPIRVSDGDLSFDRLQFIAFGVGESHACGLTAARVIYCWGDGRDGQLGANSVLHSPIAIRVVSPR